MTQVKTRNSVVGASQDYRIVPTRSGVRMVQHGTVLSEVLRFAGPTHSMADAIAAAVQTMAFGPRLALLGFAGGGMLAPLRALGGRQRVAAVDLDASGWRLFQHTCSAWAGEVDFEQVEACSWLRGRECRYDVIIEDLSVPVDSDVFKPAATWSELPPLIYRRLNADGVAIFNLLHPGEGSWEGGIRRVLRRGYVARVVHFEDYENRLLIAGRELPSARLFSRRMRAKLRSIHSRLASRISVRNWNRPMVTRG